MAELINITEVEGVKYVVVRVREIDKLNQRLEWFLSALESLTFMYTSDVDDIKSIVKFRYREYVKELVRWILGVDEVCFDRGSPRRCEAYVFSEELGAMFVSSEVYVREDKYRG
ncbi:MAG: hypothetical protein QXY39_03470 [Thermofilaceae archaeon]